MKHETLRNFKVSMVSNDPVDPLEDFCQDPIVNAFIFQNCTLYLSKETRNLEKHTTSI